MTVTLSGLLWSSARKANKGPTVQHMSNATGKDELSSQGFQGAEQLGAAKTREQDEEMAPPSPLYLHTIEAACLDELVFDPEADYEQVLAEARNYAKRVAASEPSRNYASAEKEQPKAKNKTRTAKVYYVPPPVLAADDPAPVKTKKKKKNNKSWKDLFFWRSSKCQEQAGTVSNSSSSKNNKRIKASSSGPIPVYSTDRYEPRPWHSNWSSHANTLSQSNGTKVKAQSGPLKLSSAISCTRQDAAISPYVPLKNSTNTRWSTSSSGPLYVIS